MVLSARRGQANGPDAGLDRSVPALVLKIGDYPLHSGGIGITRTLGRAGVPVHLVVEDPWTPAARSRYARARVVWPTTGTEDVAGLVSTLSRIGARLGGPTVLIPTDDEAACLAAEHADRLSEFFLAPKVDPALPARLADKGTLFRLCREHGMPSPECRFPATRDDLAAAAEELGYPVVVKNLAPWGRLSSPVTGSTTVIRDRAALEALPLPDGPLTGLLLQEYLPYEESQDWMSEVYVARDGTAPLVFTGVKLRAWPARTGVGTYARAVANPELAEQVERFCLAIGYRGIADLDLRLDRRDGRYKLVDFNPRAGAQFRMFETTSGMDVVRAMHLDLTDRPIPRGVMRDGRAWTAGHLDLPARAAYRGGTNPAPPAGPRDGLEHTWLAADDPLPAAVAAARTVVLAARRARGGGRPAGA